MEKKIRKASEINAMMYDTAGKLNAIFCYDSLQSDTIVISYITFLFTYGVLYNCTVLKCEMC